jgi:putative membrane protein
LPTVNAGLNGLALILVVAAWMAIRRKNVGLHRRLMLAAVTTSALFLVSYVLHHASACSKPFLGTGNVRALYFAILVTHVVLAAAIVPLVLLSLRRGLRMEVVAHRRVARRTAPLWVYVSVTGVIVYLMLYVWYD